MIRGKKMKGSPLKTWTLSLLLLISSFHSRAYGTVEEVLRSISIRAAESRSDALLVAQNGEFIGVYGCRSLEPIDSRSITKSFVSLAIGILLQEGRIASLETPVYEFYPEWRQGIRKSVTIRHLLDHTSGLDTNDDIVALYQFPDAVQMALASDFVALPDARFSYNNKAINLLAGIVKKISGMSVHEYLKCKLFAPLCITSETWLCDNVGNNYGMSHLSINAVDLAKIGVLITNDGCWNGRRILSSAWVNYMSQPTQHFTPFYGSLWWLGYYSMNLHWDCELINQYAASGISMNYIDALNKLQGQVLKFEGHVCYGNFIQQAAPQLEACFGSSQAVYDFFAQVESKGLPIGRWEVGQLKSISARGYLGQQLIIFPVEKLVAVRLTNTIAETNEQNDTFPELESWLALLVYEMYYDSSSEHDNTASQ